MFCMHTFVIFSFRRLRDIKATLSFWEAVIDSSEGGRDKDGNSIPADVGRTEVKGDIGPTKWRLSNPIFSTARLSKLLTYEIDMHLRVCTLRKNAIQLSRKMSARHLYVDRVCASITGTPN